MPADDHTSTADDRTSNASRVDGRAPARLRSLASRAMWRLTPAYARRRAARADALARLARVQSELQRVEERHGEQIERLEDLSRELILTAESLRRAVADANGSAVVARSTIEPIAAELSALPYLNDSPFERMRSPVGDVLGYRSSASLRGGASEYVQFEELFRGPAERVSESQRPYLALVRDQQPVLDVGCGRGEFLALLAGEGIEAQGVDRDAGMVQRCTAAGMKATLADATAYLQGLPDGSLGTVFSAQLIEHLPYAELQRLLELSRRKLRAGGLFIAETVNPHRISALKTFWVDLTHQHPIFPEVALALSAIAGFDSAYVFAPTFDDFERARFESSAYAVVATAPQRDGSDGDVHENAHEDDAHEDDAHRGDAHEDGDGR
jgi:SAM-dependent methyltransferase